MKFSSQDEAQAIRAPTMIIIRLITLNTLIPKRCLFVYHNCVSVVLLKFEFGFKYLNLCESMNLV